MAIRRPLLSYGDLTVFQNGGHPPSWICCVHLCMDPHDEYLVVFISVQNLVGIDMPAAIFNRAWLQNVRLYIYAQMEVFGGFYPINGQQSHCGPHKHLFVRSISFHPFLHSAPFYPIPRNPMLCNELDILLKVPLPVGESATP